MRCGWLEGQRPRTVLGDGREALEPPGRVSGEGEDEPSGRRDAWMGREAWSGGQAGASAGSRIAWGQRRWSVIELVGHRLVEVGAGTGSGSVGSNAGD